MKQQYTMEIINTRCNPYFTHEYALSKLQYLGYRMAVCSNSIRNSMETMMRKADLHKYLELMVSNEDVTNGKPDPEMYIKAIQHFGLKPEECLIVEDNENGIRAAKASGAHLLVVRTVDDTNFTTFSGVFPRSREWHETNILILAAGPSGLPRKMVATRFACPKWTAPRCWSESWRTRAASRMRIMYTPYSMSMWRVFTSGMWRSCSRRMPAL